MILCYLKYYELSQVIIQLAQIPALYFYVSISASLLK